MFVAQNVYVNGEYGPITVDIPFDIDDLYYGDSVSSVQEAVKSIEKTRSFIFFLSVPECAAVMDNEREISVNGNDYKGLRGVIKPCRTDHGALLGYDCEFFAEMKSTPLTLKDVYSLGGKGLSRAAHKQLELELSDHLIGKAIESKNMLISRAKKKYLKVLYKKHFDEYMLKKQLVTEIQALLTKELQKPGKDDRPKNEDATQNALSSIAYPI